MTSTTSSDPTIHVLTLNCWGLKYISAHRHPRLVEIGNRIASTSPSPSIVCLQECWTQEDYLAIRASTSRILPHGKFYWSGIFGGGLAILSEWPIVESNMYRYPLNGRPAAFYRGDWFVGKGVACARIEMPAEVFGQGKSRILEVFNTHLHAPYEREPFDSYLCHRTAQAWEIAKLMRHAVERGHFVLGCGDFNMTPASLAHQLIETHAGVKDVWRVLHPDSSLGAAQDQVEKERGRVIPTAGFNVTENGATCDSALNTWRWNKGEQKKLDKGADITVSLDTDDPRAKRLDYIFFGGGEGRTDVNAWTVQAVTVGMTERHPELKCSLSDHFSVEATLRLSARPADTPVGRTPPIGLLPSATYDTIAGMIDKYRTREAVQRRLRIGHFGFQLFISIGCLVGVWWTPNYASFILMLISSVGLSVGVIDGLMGFLFINSEIRALKEFSWEIEATRRRAAQAERGRTEVRDTVEIDMGTTGAGGHTHGDVGEPEVMREENGKMEMVV